MLAAAKATIPKQMWVNFDNLGGMHFLSSEAQKDATPLTSDTDVNTKATSAAENKSILITILLTQYCVWVSFDI